MVPGVSAPASSTIVYPESDGKPLAENTKQLRWIMVLVGNLAALYRDREDVFVAGDNLWYPVEGRPDLCNAPDAYVVFGRPKGDRGSYKQWEENNVPLTVVFEVLPPPGNAVSEMIEKHSFYEDYGVQEYYVYDPDRDRLIIYLRQGDKLLRQRFSKEFVSPRLGIRFDLSGPEMVVTRPDGRRFLTFEEMEAEREQMQQQAVVEKQRARRLVELSRKARRQQASTEELAELERLENDVVNGNAGHEKNGGI